MKGLDTFKQFKPFKLFKRSSEVSALELMFSGARRLEPPERFERSVSG
jgi:hypothetical protein